MNILHFANYGGPYKGNFIESLLGLSNKLSNLGNKMFLMLEKNSARGDWQSQVDKGGLPIRYLDCNKMSSIFELRKFIKKYNINIIHLHFFNFTQLIMFQLAITMIPKIKIFVHFHNHIFDNKLFLKRLLLKKTIICCCSESVKNDLEMKGIKGKGIYAIENAINFDRLDIINKDIQNNELFATKKFKLLMFGASYERKGVDVVLDSIINSGLTDRIQLYISLSVNNEYVKNKIIEKVGKFPSWIHLLPPCNEIGTYYRNVDAFISASREEGFCYALVEAAYCQKELIASKIPAQEDLKLPYAYWFENENIYELGKILNTIICNRTLISKLEIQKDLVVKEYNLDVWIEKLINLYSQF